VSYHRKTRPLSNVKFYYPTQLGRVRVSVVKTRPLSSVKFYNGCDTLPNPLPLLGLGSNVKFYNGCDTLPNLSLGCERRFDGRVFLGEIKRHFLHEPAERPALQPLTYRQLGAEISRVQSAVVRSSTIQELLVVIHPHLGHATVILSTSHHTLTNPNPNHRNTRQATGRLPLTDWGQKKCFFGTGFEL